MTLLEVIRSRPFSEAKAELSEVMTQVVREHRPTVIARGGGKEAMVALDLDDFRLLLGSFQFEPHVSFGDEGVVAAIESFGLVGHGADLERAMNDLLEELRAYASDYIRRYAFYAQTNRRAHAPWIMRFAATPVEEQLALLSQEPTEDAAVTR